MSQNRLQSTMLLVIILYTGCGVAHQVGPGEYPKASKRNGELYKVIQDPFVCHPTNKPNEFRKYCNTVDLKALYANTMYFSAPLFYRRLPNPGGSISMYRLGIDNAIDIYGACSYVSGSAWLTKNALENTEKMNRFQRAMIITAIGYTRSRKMLPEVIEMCKSKATAVLSLACIRAYSLLGYEKTVDYALDTLRKYGILVGKEDIAAMINDKSGYEKGRRMVYSAVSKEGHGDDERGILRDIVANMIDESIDASIRMMVDDIVKDDGTDEIRYYLLPMKRRRMLMVIDNWTPMCLEREKYMYHGRYIIDGEERRRDDYPEGTDGNGYIAPFSIDYRIIDGWDMVTDEKPVNVKIKFREHETNECRLEGK